MRRFLKGLVTVALLALAPAVAMAQDDEALILFGKARPVLDLRFTLGTLPSVVTFTRASSATDGLYTDAAASSFNTYTSGVPRMLTAGYLAEEARTQSLLNSAAPVTQTTGSLGTGTYVFWCIGTGSTTSSAGTATASGLGAITCSQGTFQTIIVTVAGTLTFTKSGTINRFQLELGAFPTSFISTAGATATRAADVATVATSAFAYNNSAGIWNAEFQMIAAQGSGRIIGSNASGAATPLQQNNTTSIGSYDGTNTPNVVATLTSINKAAVAYGGSTQSVVVNGTLATSAFAGWPSLTQISLFSNSGGASNFSNGWFRRLRYFSTRLLNPQLQALTQ